MIYKDRLKELRESKSLKQTDLAKIISIQSGDYSQYEREYTIMPLKHLNALCTYYNVSLDYIFKFNNKKQYEQSSNNINKIKAGQRLIEFRKENKITQTKLAEILNTVQQVVSKYEKGINLIATPFLYTICSKYHISADYLLGKIDSPKYLK